MPRPMDLRIPLRTFIRRRPQGALVLWNTWCGKRSNVHEFDQMNLLGSDCLGVSVSVFLDGHDIGVRPQDLQVSIGEGSGEAIDDVPFVRNLRLGVYLSGNGGDTNKTADVVLEGHDVSSGNGVFSLLDRDEGGGSRENRENAEDEGNTLVEEHDGCLSREDLASTSGLRVPRQNPPRI